MTRREKSSINKKIPLICFRKYGRKYGKYDILSCSYII